MRYGPLWSAPTSATIWSARLKSLFSLRNVSIDRPLNDGHHAQLHHRAADVSRGASFCYRRGLDIPRGRVRSHLQAPVQSDWGAGRQDKLRIGLWLFECPFLFQLFSERCSDILTVVVWLPPSLVCARKKMSPAYRSENSCHY